LLIPREKVWYNLKKSEVDQLMEVAMIPYERQEKILEALAQDELLKIEQLQSILPTVSISTLRRDLKELEKSGRVELLAGGAVKICSTAS
jgi:DeoR family fructose operon transcriptional repressor